jgi:hypothetical protein
MAHFHVKPIHSKSPAPRAADIIDIEDSDGPRAAYAALQQRLRLLRSSGANVPPELTRLEHRLLTECCAESQGR